MARSKSVVLLSSGLDSTVNLWAAKAESEVVLALTFDYGQRAVRPETERAEKIARLAGVPHLTIRLPFFSQFTKTSLVDASAPVPVGDEVKIDDEGASRRTAKAVWVPNRNGIFLNVAAAFAEGLGADWIVPGFNAEEAATFPDNSQGFLDAANAAFAFSTANSIRAKCFTTALSKSQIVRLGRELGAPLEFAWPCYFGGEEPCDSCESCRRFRRAMGESA